MTRCCSITLFLFIGLSSLSVANAQTKNMAAAGFPTHAASGQGELAVTATIVPSVGIILDESGQPHLVIANEAIATDNVSSLKIAEPMRTSETQKQRKQRK